MQDLEKRNINHQHSWIFWRKWQGDGYWKCSDPDCTATMIGSLLQGKRSLCPKCHEETLILDTDAMRRLVPKCINCRKTKKARERKRMEEVARQFLTTPEVQK